MADEIEIGTIYHSSKHGHSDWMLCESDYINLATYYKSERRPWTCFSMKCGICGRLKTDGKNSPRFCSNTNCKPENRKDGKDVYWKLIAVGRKHKIPVTDENRGQYQNLIDEYRKGVHDEHPCRGCKSWNECQKDCQTKINYDEKYADEIKRQRKI